MESGPSAPGRIPPHFLKYEQPFVLHGNSRSPASATPTNVVACHAFVVDDEVPQEAPPPEPPPYEVSTLHTFRVDLRNGEHTPLIVLETKQIGEEI